MKLEDKILTFATVIAIGTIIDIISLLLNNDLLFGFGIILILVGFLVILFILIGEKGKQLE